MSLQRYKKSHSLRKEWDRIFQQKTLMLKPPILCKKMQDKTSLDRDSHSLLGRICNPTAISMSICNAENGKRKRIINPYTKCCRITNTAERGDESTRKDVSLYYSQEGTQKKQKRSHVTSLFCQINWNLILSVLPLPMALKPFLTMCT